MKTAKQLRDDGIAAVLANAEATWTDKAVELVRRYANQRVDFIGEEFRLCALKCGLPPPHHHNAWGGVMMAAAKKGYIRATYMTRNMTTAASHARRSIVWVREV